MKKLIIALIVGFLFTNLKPAVAQVCFTQDVFGGCAPLTVNFTNESAFPCGMDTTGIRFIWDFDDGFSDTSYHATHIYTTPGWYGAILYADSAGFPRGSASFGVFQVDGHTDTFYMTPSPTACPGENISFETFDQYNFLSWDFGDGDSAFWNFAQHSYADTGIYLVRLIINTCSGTDTTTLPIFITNTSIPPAQIQANQDTVCPNDEVYFSTQGNYQAASYQWYFGDGDSSTLSNLAHAYTDTGSYQVILTVTNICGNSNSDTVYITVDDSVPANANNFGWWPGNACPFEVINFNTNESGSFAWDFGDGNTSTLRNPQHFYSDTGTYNIQLIHTNGCGNSDTSSPGFYSITIQYDSFNIPGAWIEFEGNNMWGVDTLTICPGANVRFRNNSWSSTSKVDYLWLFGDGDSATTRHTSHVFNSPGFWEVQMIITNSCQATDTAFKWVDVDPLAVPNAMLEALPPVICPGEKVFFFDDDADTDNDGNIIGNYVYNIWFGDGDSSVNITSVDSVIGILGIHTYTSPGIYNYVFTVTNGCGQTDSLDTLVVVTPLAPKFAFVDNSTTGGGGGGGSNDGCPGDTVELFAVGGIDSLTSWDFGDGSPLDTGMIVKHVYFTTDTASATVTNGCGTDTTYTTIVTISNGNLPSAWFDMDKTYVCGLDTVNFEYGGGGGGGPGGGVENNYYYWDFGDSTYSTLRDPSHLYTTGGVYSIYLTVTNGCGSNTQTNWPGLIVDLPAVSFSGLAAQYCIDGAGAPLTGNPLGGTFSGNGRAIISESNICCRTDRKGINTP